MGQNGAKCTVDVCSTSARSSIKTSALVVEEGEEAAVAVKISTTFS